MSLVIRKTPIEVQFNSLRHKYLRLLSLIGYLLLQNAIILLLALCSEKGFLLQKFQRENKTTFFWSVMMKKLVRQLVNGEFGDSQYSVIRFVEQVGEYRRVMRGS